MEGSFEKHRQERKCLPPAIEQLRLNERSYRSLVSAMATIVWLCDDDGRVIEKLSSWEEFTGQAWEDYHAFGWLEAVHPNDRAALKEIWREKTGDEQSVVEADLRLRDRKGNYSYMHLKAVPVLNRDGQTREWMGSLADITKWRQAEEALRENEQRMRLILESSTDFAIFTIDMVGKVTSWNAGAQQLLGYSEDEICGKDFHRIFLKEDLEAGAPDEEMRSALENGRGLDQRWHLRKDGSRFWADGLLMPLRNEETDPFGYLKIIRDFTEQKKSEDNLRALTEELEQRVDARTKELRESRSRLRSLVVELNRAEQMERQRIAAELHDSLAQLLTAARLSLKSAIREMGDPNHPSLLNEVQEIIIEATRITRNLMTELSGPPVLEHDDLVATLQWLVEKTAHEGLSIELSSNEPRIPLERDVLTLFYQSVRELLLNVLKHSGVSKAWLKVHCMPEKIEVEVIDKGCGFLQEEPWRTPKHEGGFGILNINERFGSLGGELYIDSHPGGGTRATLSLPTQDYNALIEAPPHPPPPEKEENQRLPDVDRVTVLLVDDHCMIREGFRSIIEKKPDLWIVGEAADGIEALEKARQLRPDVVVMDINMPRMNGLEATRRLLKEIPETTVIGLSLYAQADMAAAIKKAGAAAYVCKEEAFDILCDVIRTHHTHRSR